MKTPRGRLQARLELSAQTTLLGSICLLVVGWLYSQAPGSNVLPHSAAMTSKGCYQHPPEKPNLPIVQITVMALNSYLGYTPCADASTTVKVMGGTGGFFN